MFDPGEVVAIAYDGGSRIPFFEKADVFWVRYNHKSIVRRQQILSVYPESTDDLLRQIEANPTDVIIAKGFAPKSIARLKAMNIKLYTFDGGQHAAYKAWKNGGLKEL